MNCIQCGSCSGSCVVARFNPGFDPQKIMKMVLLGQERILAEEYPWYCSGCLLCSERCPEDADPAGVILSIKQLALRKKIARGVGAKHVKAITQSVKRYGHLNEIMIPFQTKGYSPWLALGYTRMGLVMLRRRKLPRPLLLPNRDPSLKEIFSRLEGGTDK
ncbi:MAG: 4Fe-4S dicluster domain-containing protein [Candidatus Heimdallarchaeota archaeon]